MKPRPAPTQPRARPTAQTLLRVSGASSPKALAGALAGLMREGGAAELQAIGPAAVNQAVKALAIARGYLAHEALDLVAQPAFVTLGEAEGERTALHFTVRVVPLAAEPAPLGGVQPA